MNDFSRGRNNPTSQAAFAAAAPARVLRYQHLLSALRKHGPMTSKELVKRTRIPLQTVSGRLAELKAQQKVRGTGERRDKAEVIALVAAQTELFV